MAERESDTRFMSPSYVEDGSFKVVEEKTVGALGRILRLRQYRLVGSPDMRPSDDVSHSIVAKWATAGQPEDAVFHYGSFHRVTVDG